MEFLWRLQHEKKEKLWIYLSSDWIWISEYKIHRKVAGLEILGKRKEKYFVWEMHIAVMDEMQCHVN